MFNVVIVEMHERFGILSNFFYTGSGLDLNHLFRECSMGTALHAACSGGHLSVVHILLQAGAHLDVLDRDHNTPLMLAAVSNHNDIVKYLVKAGANVMLKVRM